MADEEKGQSPQGENKDGSVTSQIRNVADDIAHYVGKHRIDSVAYIVLLLGVCISFASPMIGGLMVGVVTGLYFGGEALMALHNVHEIIEAYGPVKSLIAVTTVLFLTFHTFWLVLGFAATVGVKAVMESRGHQTK